MWYFLDTLILKYFSSSNVLNKTENRGKGQVLTIFLHFFQILYNYLYKYYFLNLLIKTTAIVNVSSYTVQKQVNVLHFPLVQLSLCYN
jgi:hypothetical protein